LEEVMSSLFNNTQGAAHTPSMIDIYLKDGTVIHSLVEGFDMDDTTTIGSENEHQVVVHDDGLGRVCKNVWCIPHMPNQELFNAEVIKASEMDGKGKHLLLHCNYKNAFTENSDHSLNLNDDQVNLLMEAGWTLVFGHEHVGRVMRSGKVVIVGNQYPSSVIDCIGDDDKHCLRIQDGLLHLERTWAGT
jgi:hypothetical protein